MPRLSAEQPPVPVIPLQEKINILMVDDRPDGLLTLEAVLNCPEYQLVKAGSGREALSCLLNYDFAVILLDVQMPDLDGFETAKIIKRNELFKHIPIIFVTAISKEPKNIDEGYGSGAVDYLFKPFEPHILKSKVAVFVDLFKKNLKIKEQAHLLLQAEKRERERRLNEVELENLRRYRHLADAIPHIVWKLDREGDFDYFNRFWFDYTGLSLEDSYREGWRTALQPGDYLLFMQKFEVARREKAELEAECRIRRKEDGKYRWHLVRMVPEIRNGDVMAWIGTCTDIHDRKEAQEELELKIQERTAELSLLNRALKTEMEERVEAQKEVLDISEREQKRIGQDLHDGLAQELVAISFMSQVLEQKLAEKDLPEVEDAKKIQTLLKKAVEGTRSLSRGFYPIELERHGLLAAVQELAVNVEKMCGVPIEYRYDPEFRLNDKAAAYHLYRITQEAVNNAIKHSRAKRISIFISTEGPSLVLTIKDNGQGFSASQDSFGGMGLKTMRYRARTIGAALTLDSGEGQGTCIVCSVPLKDFQGAAVEFRKEEMA